MISSTLLKESVLTGASDESFLLRHYHSHKWESTITDEITRRTGAHLIAFGAIFVR